MHRKRVGPKIHPCMTHKLSLAYKKHTSVRLRHHEGVALHRDLARGAVLPGHLQGVLPRGQPEPALELEGLASKIASHESTATLSSAFPHSCPLTYIHLSIVYGPAVYQCFKSNGHV